MYGLVTATFNLSERRRLNGFYCRCLRTIWGIKAAFVSRIGNQTVLELAQQRPLTHTLAKQQLLLFERVLRAGNGSLLRDCAFSPGSLTAACDMFVRRRGRPRLEWVTQVRNAALKVTGSMRCLEGCLYSEEVWRHVIAAWFKHNVFE